MRIDHLAVAAETLDDGVAAVEAALGMALDGGGQHLAMGTHNRLIGLGDVYLEVIAIDPTLPGPGRARWFDLDRFSGPPRLTTWITATDDIDADLARAPVGAGVPMTLTRGDYLWQIAVPDDGVLPFDGAFPALIQWQGAAHPARALPDRGLRLVRLEITHPQADTLGAAIAPMIDDPRIAVVQGSTIALRAEIATPHGVRVL